MVLKTWILQKLLLLLLLLLSLLLFDRYSGEAALNVLLTYLGFVLLGFCLNLPLLPLQQSPIPNRN